MAGNGGGGRAKKVKRVVKDKKVCVGCDRELSLIRFYATESPLFPDGKSPICKECIQEQIEVEGLEAVQRILRQIDRPFNVSEWNKAVTSGKEPFGWYLRSINSLPQYKGRGYSDSVGGSEKPFVNYEDMEESELYGTPSLDVKRKWGLGYSNKEYYELENLWTEMMDKNDIQTPQHKKDLSLYCKLTVLVDRALENNNTTDFEKLNRQLTEVKKNSGFRPIDKKSGSESAGIRNFSTIFAEIESEGFIEPYPIEFNQDIVDRTIMYLGNYTRKLLQMEQMIVPPDDTPQVDEGDI
jgi:hypothetical protein